MKKLLFWAVSAFLILYSCSKDDDSKPTIVGTWNLSKEMIISGKDGSTLASKAVDACERQSNFVFNADQKAINNTYKIKDNNCILQSSRTYTYTYDYASKKLTIFYDTGVPPDSYFLNLLTENELQFIENQVDFNNDGIEDKYIRAFNR